ncbi:hypothetical protein B6U84_00865 [Candidatus Bathyarchaeota archaeon ex4484_40]|nr:MAG: hypothetical protein B6U84_00865 [Candidatus Bathyarchaeota archaeon ex4484_40]
MQIDPETGKHYTKKQGLPKEIKNRLEGYIKFALKLYNKEIAFGETTAQRSVNKTLIIPKLFAKVKNGFTEFMSCNRRDQEKLKLAKNEIRKLLKQDDPDVPIEPIAPFGVTIRTIAYGFNTWHKHFNPRQLIVAIKLVKLIREAGKIIEKETKSIEYAEAVVTYLAISLANYIRHNSIVTSVEPTRKFVAHTLALRRPTITWNWVDINPTIDVIGSWTKSLEHTSAGLKYLVASVKIFSDQKVKVLKDDATLLNSIINKNFNLIITDPPYYDDVQYAEISDFYYVWLKRALSDVAERRLVPRFLPEAFFERIGEDWVEVSTQWEKYALSEVSLNPPRLGTNATKEDGVAHFQNLLNSSFTTMASRLKEKGLLVTYYAHTSPEAWKALLKAGWESAGFRVTNAFPLATESAQSVVSRGKLSMDTSILVVWRKIASDGVADASKLYDEMVEAAAERARELINAGWIGRDLVIGTLAAALSVATKYREVRVMGRVNTDTLVEKYVYPAAYLGLVRAYARKAELRDGVKSPEAMFYLLVKVTLPGAKMKTLESTDIRILSIGTSMDVREAVNNRILLPGREGGGARVAKAKTMVLAEPASASRNAVAELLTLRDVGIESPNIRCSVDMLHLLEYYALAYSRREFARLAEELKSKYPTFFDEAFSMARIFSRVLPKSDPEMHLCRRMLEEEERF